MNKDEIFNQFAQYFAKAVKIVVDEAVENALKNVSVVDNSELEYRIKTLEEQAQDTTDKFSELDSLQNDFYDLKDNVREIKDTLEEHDLDEIDNISEAVSDSRDAKESVDGLCDDVEKLESRMDDMEDDEIFVEKVRAALIAIASRKEDENG